MNRRIRILPLLVAAALPAGFARGDWLYNAGAGTITDGTSTLSVSASGSELTIGTGHAAVGSVLDLSMPVANASGTPFSVVGIANRAFYGRSAIERVVYPATLRSIGGEAFSGCTSLALVQPSLVPDTVTAFNLSGRGVYESCTSVTQDFRIGYAPIATGGGQWIANTGITRADFGPCIATIPNYCFERTNLKDLRLSEGLVTFEGGSETGSITNVAPTFPSTLRTLNQSFRNLKCEIAELRLDNATALGGNFAFSTVRKAWFGPGIKAFPDWLFQQDSHITNITICATNPIVSIGRAAFASLSEMEEFTFMGPAQDESVLGTIFAGVTDLRPVVRVSKRQGGWVSLGGLERDLDAIRASLGDRGEEFADVLARPDLLGLYTAPGLAKRVWMVDSPSIYDPAEPWDGVLLTVAVSPAGVAAVSPAAGTLECRAGDEVPVSAPARGTDGANCLSCTGWALERLDAGHWTAVSSGTSGSFVLEIPADAAGAEFRLRWLYAVADDVRCLTVLHRGTERIERSSEPILSSGFRHWYPAGTPVTLVARGNDAVPRSTFVRWVAGGADAGGNPFAWDGASDVEVEPVFIRDWLYDAGAGTITDGSSTLAVSASGSELTIGTGHAAVGSVLDFSAPVTDASGAPYSIVGIAFAAFKGRTAIERVVYPATLRSIGGEAFSGCSSLARVLPALVPDTVTAFNLSGRGVYESCTSVTQDFRIGYSPIATGGGQWIRETRITRADFGPCIETIPNYCFERTNLRELRLSEGLVTFEGGSETGSITNVAPTFPLSLRTLNQSFRSLKCEIAELRLDNATALGGNFAFSTVRKAWFGPGIKSFPDWLFQQDSHITNITICATNPIVSIGTAAFASLGELEEISFMGPAQPKAVVDTILANVADLRAVAYVSRDQGGWEDLDGMILTRRAARETVTPEEWERYAPKEFPARFIGLYRVAGSPSRRVWFVHRPSIYDKPKATVLIVK